MSKYAKIRPTHTDIEGESSVEPAYLYQKYAPKLFRLANKHLSPKLRKRVEPDDILQSVFRSFFCRYQNEIETLSSNELWKLLITITINKIRRQGRFHSAEKRDWHSEQELSAVSSNFEGTDYREPSSSDLVAMCDELAWLNRQLNPEQRRCLEMRLQGSDTTEIATELRTTDRTIRRWLKGIQDLMTFREKTFEKARSSATIKTLPLKLDWPLGLPAFDYREFILEQMLGAGSICKAYRALRISNREYVCLKILRQQWRDRPGFQQQLLNEAAVLRSISHPAIVPIHGVGQMPNGSLFLVMKWISGSSFSQLLKGPTLSMDLVEKIEEQICQCLTELHSMGITHGDLHAGNVLIDNDEKVWLTDFSFAQIENDKIQLNERIKQDWTFFEKLKAR
jgi:predicted Ser/Thr protein kinase